MPRDVPLVDGEDDEVTADDDRRADDDSDNEGETTKPVAQDGPETNSRTADAAVWNFILVLLINNIL